MPARRSTAVRPTDDDLLDAALGVFAERGFTVATMSAVATACDSTKPTLYAHFGNKDSLHARLLEREADTCRQHLFTAYERNAGLGLREQVDGDVRAFFDYAREHPDGFRLLFGADIGERGNAVRERLTTDIDAQVTERIHRWTGAGGPATEDEEQVAAMLVGVAYTAARHAIDGGRDLDRACGLAVAFATAALERLAG